MKRILIRRGAALAAASLFMISTAASAADITNGDASNKYVSAETNKEKLNKDKSKSKDSKKQNEKENKSGSEDEKKHEDARISSKRGTLTIIGDKSDAPKRYRIILKKLYTSDDIGKDNFYTDVYDVPGYAQAIEIQGDKPIAFNRENVIESDDNGKAVFSGILLGEYEVREEDESADLPYYTVRIPKVNSDKSENFNIEIKSEKLKGGAFEALVMEGSKPVRNMKYGIYKVIKRADPEVEKKEEENSGEENPEAEKPAEEEKLGEGEVKDRDGNIVKKMGSDLVTDENGYMSRNDLEPGDYYVSIESPAQGYIKTQEHIDFQIDALGAVKERGAVKIGKVVSKEIQAYPIPKLAAALNDKKGDIKSNLETPIKLQYSMDIPRNIENYEDIYLNIEENDELEYGDIRVDCDGSDVAFEKNEEEGKISLSLNHKNAYKGRKKLNIEMELKIKGDIEEKDPITLKSYLDYKVADEYLREEVADKDITPTWGYIKLVNTDKKSGSVIQGGVFELRDGKKAVKKGTTDTRGVLEWEKVPYGNYQLVQTKGSSSYREPYRAAEPEPVKVDDKNVEKKITVKNSKLNDGFFRDENMIYFIVILILILIIAFFIRRSKKQKKRRIEAKIRRMRDSV